MKCPRSGHKIRLTLYSSQILQRFDHFPVVRKATLLVLGEDHCIIGLDVKDTAAALNQIGIEPQRIFDLGRQTGGLGFIVSLHAIGN